MARKNPPYTPEFRRQMIELVRSGRSPESLAKEFEPTELVAVRRVAGGTVEELAPPAIEPIHAPT